MCAAVYGDCSDYMGEGLQAGCASTGSHAGGKLCGDCSAVQESLEAVPVCLSAPFIPIVHAGRVRHACCPYSAALHG